jgi:hypothetical protein
MACAMGPVGRMRSGCFYWSLGKSFNANALVRPLQPPSPCHRQPRFPFPEAKEMNSPEFYWATMRKYLASAEVVS